MTTQDNAQSAVAARPQDYPRGRILATAADESRKSTRGRRLVQCQRVGANVYIPQNEALNKRITKEAYQTLPYEFGQRL
jgi:hypothetical protein